MVLGKGHLWQRAPVAGLLAADKFNSTVAASRSAHHAAAEKALEDADASDYRSPHTVKLQLGECIITVPLFDLLLSTVPGRFQLSDLAKDNVVILPEQDQVDNDTADGCMRFVKRVLVGLPIDGITSVRLLLSSIKVCDFLAAPYILNGVPHHSHLIASSLRMYSIATCLLVIESHGACTVGNGLVRG